MSLDLSKVATVLEKAAEYLESTEAEKLAEQTEVRRKAASELAEKIADISGESVEGEIVDKLASLDPEISSFLSRIAGSDEAVESLGGPGSRTKTASSSEHEGGNFVAWVTGP